ncbi:Aldo/keto reductase [Aureobasidium pullulans]|uniref:Aldo/keto reductase n=1 Tax=Aureobasidium pullulans TaxID=5580 RepID=A0A4S9EVX1_AURPU|nr:Aldo/keto reductase [Aureobasidium pullulans]
MSAPKSLLARYRQLAPNASVRVSPLCLGAMTFGDGAGRALHGKTTLEESTAILDAFYKAGGNFIDTANGYQNGESERRLGQWMVDNDNRDEMVIATKFTGGYMRGEPNRIQANFSGNGTKSMKMSLEASLKKLQTSYVDILYLHDWDSSANIVEVMHGLNDLVVAGKVLYLGVSDTPAWIVSKANQYARDHGLRPFVLYQGLWNAGVRDFEREIIPMAREEGMGLAPWGPVGEGRFKTKDVLAKLEQGTRGLPITQKDRDVSAVLEKVAERKGNTLYQIAVAYLMHKTTYVFPIIGSTKAEHLSSNIEALAIELSPEDIHEIEQAYPFNHGFPHTFLSGSHFEGEKVESRQIHGPEDVALTKWSGVTIDWVKGSKPILPSKMK